MSASTSIWLVFGRCGEYSDFQEWPVIAFHTEPEAEAYRVKCQQRTNEIIARAKNRYNLEETNEFDPQMRADYTGTEYILCMVELVAPKEATP